MFEFDDLTGKREVFAVEALLAAGRRGDAQTRADAFLRAHPGSAHAERMAKLLR